MSKIPTRSRLCCKGEELFEPGSSYSSTIKWERGEWKRFDFCPKCFEKLGQQGPTWHGKIPLKQEKKLTPDEEAYARFCSLHKNGQSPELLFLLALYLERKKMLIRCHMTLFEEPNSGETFEVKSVAVNDQAKEELLELFHA